MKIALITDTHFGVRNDSQQFVEYQKKFFDTLFFPTLKERGIKEVIDLGDTFDRRKYINYHTLLNIKEFYFDPLKENDINVHIIIGNHSTYHKNSNDVNSPDLILSEYTNVKSYKDPKHIRFGDSEYLLMPWINSENIEECYRVMEESKAHVMFGHFELTGHTLKGNFKFNKGISLSDIKKFEYIFSGHYHHRSSVKNFMYLGAPYQFDWGDLDEKRGFYIFDTETLELEFIENPYKIYKKIFWPTDNDVVINESTISDIYVKIVVQDKPNIIEFDSFVDKIESFAPHNVFIEEVDHIFSDEECEIDSIEDTLTTIKTYISNEEIVDEKKDKLLELLSELYYESLNME